MLNILHVGIGPLGAKTVRYAVERGCFNIVGAVDTDPAKAGRDLGELCGIEPLGIAVSRTLGEAIAGKRAEVALVTTVSSIVALESQVVELAQAGLNVVSTCEELFFPWKTNPGVAGRIDQVCRRHNVTCVGTGVNPGYLMDLLPTILSGLCRNVKKVEVWRVQDASVRRVPFQQKIGAALTLEEFEAKKKDGSLRHVGLRESVDFIADRFGWKLDRNEETLEPVIAETQIDGGYKPISKGMARGVHQVGKGFIGDEQVITLNFRAAVGEPESDDRIRIDGDPLIESRIAGGVNGDVATCAIALNTVRSVLEAAPGLKTMAQIPPIGFFE